MFNLGGAELLVILLLALIVLGPQRLPDAARQVGKFMGELRRLSSGFQNEVRNAFEAGDEPRPPTELRPVPEPMPDDDGDEEDGDGDATDATTKKPAGASRESAAGERTVAGVPKPGELPERRAPAPTVGLDKAEPPPPAEPPATPAPESAGESKLAKPESAAIPEVEHESPRPAPPETEAESKPQPETEAETSAPAADPARNGQHPRPS